MRFFFFKVDSGGVFSAVGLVIGVDDIGISDGTIDVDVAGSGTSKGIVLISIGIFGFFAFAFEVVSCGDTTKVSGTAGLVSIVSTVLLSAILVSTNLASSSSLELDLRL